MELPSTKPYLVRAIWEWCCDNGLTPHIAVQVDARTVVPREFVRDGQIVLNLGSDATNKLQIGNEYVEFQARFGGVARQLTVPIAQVSAIYARENGAGMAFDIEAPSARPNDADGIDSPAGADEDEPPAPKRPPSGRPNLQRVK